VYAGTFSPPKRVIAPVMAALKLLNDTKNGGSRPWYFHYYGKHSKHVREAAERFGLMGRVVLHGMVPRAEALSAVRGAGVAVVITSVLEEASLKDKGMVTAKVFETMALGTPVLLVTPADSDARVMAESTGFAQCFTGSDMDGMASFLRDTMCGRNAQPKNLAAYAWPNIAKGLDAILRGVFARTLCDKGEVVS